MCDTDQKNGHAVHMHPVVSNLKFAFLINLAFAIIEIVGGILTNSIAILSDAIHDLGDSFAIGSSLFFERYAGKRRDARFSYGYKRFSPLAALINSLILIGGSVLIISQAIPRLFAPEPVHAIGMLGLAALGVAMNGIAVFRLRNNSKSLNQRAVMLHLLEDALGWLAVLVGSIFIWIFDLPIIDPILSLAVAAFILYNAIRNLKPIFAIFLQAMPTDINQKAIENAMQQLPGVIDVHDLHAWSLDGEFNILSLHLTVPDATDREQVMQIKSLASEQLSALNVQHATLEIEYESETCAVADC